MASILLKKKKKASVDDRVVKRKKFTRQNIKGLLLVAAETAHVDE